MKYNPSDSFKPEQLKVRAKIWLEDDQGQTIFGYGLLLAMEAIERTGSMNSAAITLTLKSPPNTYPSQGPFVPFFRPDPGIKT